MILKYRFNRSLSAKKYFSFAKEVKLPCLQSAFRQVKQNVVGEVWQNKSPMAKHKKDSLR